MNFLNYHHLRYFRAIAKEGSLTAAAQRLGVSQSSVSMQLRQLEERLGQPLLHREKKALVLTEAGRIALDYAERIFRAGDEMVATLERRQGPHRRALRVGAVATMSRNFQLQCLRPFLGREDVELVLRSGGLRELLAQLRAHTLDVVLANQSVPGDAEARWHCSLLDEQPAALVGKKRRGRSKFTFPDDLGSQPLLLPTMDSELRTAFDLAMERAGIRPVIAAEVDDMAMLRLLAREGAGLALVPPVVVAGELERGQLVVHHRFAEICERFYAITPSRSFPNPLLAEWLDPLRRMPANR